MATTNFVDRVTPINASWLNDVDAATYEGAGTYTPAGTGAVARTIQAKLRESVSVNDYGASRSASAATNSTAFAAAIAANPGKLIMFPDSSYSFDTKISVTADNTRLYFPSCTLIFTGTGDAIHFYCTSTATTSTFLNACGILGNLSVYRATSDTSGAGVRLTQCNLFTMDDVRVDNFFGGYLQEGGQLNKIKGFTTFMSSSVYGAYVPGSYQMKFTAAPIDGGLYQVAFTTAVDKVLSGGSYIAEYGLWFECTDGIGISNGYVAGSKQSLALFKPGFSGKSVSGVSLGITYLDAKNISTGTTNCIEVLDDGFAGASLVNNIDVSNCHSIGNTPGKGIYSTHPNIQTFIVDPSRFVNCAGAEVDVTGGDTGFDSWIGIPLPWTPIFTFATPGDLAQNYSTQLGDFLRTKSGMVHMTFSISAAPTFTTASGNLRIGTMPIPSLAVTNRTVGAMSFSGITKAGYTQFMARMSPVASTQFEVIASGSAVAIDNVTAANFTTTGFVVFEGTISYVSGELG